MKKIKYIIPILFIGILFTSGCEKFLDVNHNPNKPEESRLDLVFPAAVEGSAAKIGNSFMSLGAIWAQHWTSDINKPGFMGEDSYSVLAGDYSYDLRGWNSFYYGSLKDYDWVRDMAKEDENWNYYLMATVMQCYTYQVMADLWDEIPVTEALLPESLKEPAHFEKGKDVYGILISRIDEALEKDFQAETNTKPGSDDLVFSGSISSWKAFANTLKLKMFIRQRFVEPTNAKTGIKALYDANTEFLSEDAKFSSFKQSEGKGNYWYESNLRNKTSSLVASNTLLMYLDENNDPRLNSLFLEPTSGHKGIWQGDFRDNFDSYGVSPKFSIPIIDELAPVYFMSLTESKFLQAEANMILDNPATTVEGLYKEAIDASCAKYGVDATDIYNKTYGRFPVDGTKTEQFEMLMMQKWVALANGQGLEAFFEHNRTHIPKESIINPTDNDWDADNYVPGEFTVSVQGVLAPPIRYPKRLLFSATERSKNPNTPAAVEINVPVWWEVTNPSVE